VPEAYEEIEVRRFFAALTRERDRLAFEFLLKTGVREREMTTLEWTDLQLGKEPTVTIQARKPHLKFRTKTGKGRTIPLQKGLALQLRLWREKNPDTRLVFGTKGDKEDSHFYRICVETAEAAGMDPARFWLHKWRDTFGTWTCRAMVVDLPTLPILDGAQQHHADTTVSGTGPGQVCSRYLFDGQTKDMLASSKREKGRDSGSLYDPNDIMAGYDKANAMIDSRLADDRKQ